MTRVCPYVSNLGDCQVNHVTHATIEGKSPMFRQTKKIELVSQCKAAWFLQRIPRKPTQRNWKTPQVFSLSHLTHEAKNFWSHKLCSHSQPVKKMVRRSIKATLKRRYRPWQNLLRWKVTQVTMTLGRSTHGDDVSQKKSRWPSSRLVFEHLWTIQW